MAASALFPHHGWRRLVVSSLVVAVCAVLALAALFGGRERLDRIERAGIPIPLPVFEIEAVSGSHRASLLNLPIPYVGAPQVPIPVDINGDLLPDVTAAVNLVNAQGVFNNPPNPGELIAPNIEFTRLFLSPILSPGNLPLRIGVKLTLLDSEGEPPLRVRFGYETGPGGAIPPKFKAVLGGIEGFFNPLRARIDTTGGLLIGLDPRLPDLGLGPRSPAYSGPLTTFASLDSGPTLRADLDLRFRPMPDLVEVTYESTDDGTNQFTFAHSEPEEVDLDINGHIVSEDLVADADARIDRLPRQAAFSVQTGEGSGAMRFESALVSGRLPDLSASVVLDDEEFERPLRARVDAESLPDLMAARWLLRPGEAPEVDFEGSGQGIGSIEARLQNYEGQPTAFEPWVPEEQQHVSIQAGPGGVLIDDTLVQARLERIRSASVHTTPSGSIEGSVQIGDGERPLQVHGEIDLRPEGAPYINATATISPLPDTIDFIITPSSDADGGPMRIVYTPSETIDVDTQALVGLPDTVGDLACGDPGTICADVDVRNVPTSIEARVYNLPGDTRVEVDALPRTGATPLDVFASATVGPVDALGNPADAALAAPVHAEVNIQGLPRFLRFRTAEDAAQGLERLDVRTCDLDYVTNTCAPGTDDEVAEMDFAVRNWEDRPADLPSPPQSGPIFLTATARGLADTNELVNYEATGRMTNFRQATFLNTPDLTAAKVDIGSGEDFRTWIDIEDVDLNGGSPADGRVDLDGDIRINPLPTPLTFCVAQAGRAITTDPIDDDITAACEDPDPFGDGTAQTGPMTLAYRVGEEGATTAFDVIADIEARGDFPFVQPDLPLDFGRFDRIGSHLALTGIPGDFTAYIATPGDTAFDLPGDDEATGTRIRTIAPGADDTSLDLDVELTTAGVDCADPDPDGVAGAVCAGLLIDGLPEFASMLFSTTSAPDSDESLEQRFEAYGCDYEFFAAPPDEPACRPGTAGSIGVVELSARAHAGEPDGVDTYLPPSDVPHASSLADIDAPDELEIEAGLRIEDLRAVQFIQNTEGTALRTDVGDGTDPLVVHGRADLRDAAAILDDEYLLDLRADLQLTPLPDTFSFVQTGPGANQTDPMHIAIDSPDDVALTASAEIRHASSDGPDCGASATLCAELIVDAIPAELDVDLTRTSGPIVGRERASSTELHIDLDPHAPGDPKPRIDVHASAGVPADVPVVGGLPLFADLALVGIPLHSTIDLDNREVLMGSNEVRASNLERFQFHACDIEGGACRPDTEGRIDLIEASARTVDLRPTNFPAPPAPGPGVPPAFISLAGRGEALEAYARIPNISEVQFVNQAGVIAATANVGGGTPPAPVDLGINVDVIDLPIQESIDLGEVTYIDPVLDARAALTISPFPGDLSFCLREGGIRPVPTPSGIDFAAACEDEDPFDTDDPLEETPLSIAFDAEGTSFDVDVDAEITIDGVDDDGAALPTNRLVGRLALGDVPDELSFHFLQPTLQVVPNAGGFTIQPQGQYRARLDAPGATSGLDVSFAAEHLVGAGAQCEDPRPTVSATCVSAELSNLPTEVDFLYDPDLDLLDPDVDLGDLGGARNLFVFADGPEPSITVDSVHFSRVRPRLGPDDAPVTPLDSDVIVADVDLGEIALPLDVRGTIFLPEGEGAQPIIDLVNATGDVLPEITLAIRSFIAPNPFVDYDTRYAATGGLPARTVPNNGEPVHTLALLQRGDDFRLNATLPAVRRVSARAVLDEDRNPLGTFAVDVGFAQGFNVRAFLDLQPDQTTRIYADARLDDIPAAMSLCFRGARLPDAIDEQPFPGTATWCDSPEVRPDEGAFEFAQEPNSGESTMDVDAFTRLELGGGTTLISGRVDIDEIPQVMRARLPGEVLEVRGLRPQFNELGGPLVPDGIDRIAFQAATFDIDPTDAGYGAFATNPNLLPYPYRPLVGGPFPAAVGPIDGSEFVHLAGDVPAQQFHVRGQLGRTDGGPSSQLQQLYYSTLPCDQGAADAEDQRDAARASLAENRPDYPHLPSDDGTSHTCVSAVFDPLAFGEPDETNPLSLRADVDVDEETTIRLRQGGIDDMPEWFELNIADAPPFQDMVNERGWRRPCGPHTDAFANCMAPLIRFDQPNDAVLFGAAEVGARTDLDAVLDVEPTGPAPDFDVLPTAGGWDGQFTADRGARVRIIDFPDAPPFDEEGKPQDIYSETRTAISGTFRLPVPFSLTVDTPQKFALDVIGRTPIDKHEVNGSSADDLRFRVAVHDATGEPMDTDGTGAQLGDVALYLARQNHSAETVIGRPCSYGPVAQEVVETYEAWFGADVCPEYRQGIPLPGEMGITLYSRKNITDLGGDRIRVSEVTHVDGRLSQSLSVGLRMRSPGEPDIVAAAYDVPGGFGPEEIADPGRPTFRLRFEKIDDKDLPKDEEPEDTQDSGSVDEASINWLGDITTRFEVGSLRASVDFLPAGATQAARRVDAVVFTDLSFPHKVGVDLAGFTEIAGGSPANLDAFVEVQVTELFIDGDTTWNLPIDRWLGDAVEWIAKNILLLTHIPGGDWVAEALGWLVEELLGLVFDALEELISPLTMLMDGRAHIELELKNVNRFTYRSSLLHAWADAVGPGSVDIGPIDLNLSEFFIGVAATVGPIDLPTEVFDAIADAVSCVLTLGFDCDTDFVPKEIPKFTIPILGYGVLPFGQPMLPFPRIQLDMRDCDALGGFASIVPFLEAGFDNTNTLDGPDGPEDFAITTGFEPRFGIGGVAAIPLFGLAGGLFNSAIGMLGLETILPPGLTLHGAFNLLVGMAMGPIVCFGFDFEPSDFQGIDNTTTDPAAYNPGNVAGQEDSVPGDAENIIEFVGHPVPGQPGQPDVLPPESQDPTGQPVPTAPPVTSEPPVPTEVAPPTPRPPLYSGPTGAVISTNEAMCGVHEFDSLTVSGDLTVAVVPNPALVHGRAACEAGDEGTLELRADQLAVTGSITADEIMDDVPDFSGAQEDDFRATGSSGGTNAGHGYNGSAESTALTPYNLDNSPFTNTVTTGGPGSAIPGGFTRDNQTGPIASAGPAGLGGGAIVLRADTLLAVDGDLSANGGGGAGDLTGACDANEFEDPANDEPILDDDGNVIGFTPVSDDPPFEHTGFMGAGGGAGGGILLQARTEINVLGDDRLSATGGNGGGGRLGAGGGGGGGVIRVLAPIVSGVDDGGIDEATEAGLNGGLAPAGEDPCEDVPEPSDPVIEYDHDQNSGTPPLTAESDPNGFGTIVNPPSSRLEGYGPFWFQGGPQTPPEDRVEFTGYLTAGGGPGPVAVVACGVRLPTSAASPTPNAIIELAEAKLPIDNGDGTTTGTMPSVDEPCGSRPGSDIVEMGQTTFTGSIQPPDADSQIALGAAQTGYYGLYSTAIRAKSADNDCLDPTDEDSGGTPFDDADDCVVEPLESIDWVIGIDATAPAVTLNAPVDGDAFVTGQIVVDFDATDLESGVFADAAGNVHGECRIVPAGTDPDDVEFARCATGQPFGIPAPDGPKTFEIRVRDRAGNVSDVIERDFDFDQGIPAATVAFTGGVLGNGDWYTTAPGLLFDNYVGLQPAANPYAYRFDNGLEEECGPVSDPDGEAPFDVPCPVDASEVAVLSAGEHTLHYTAISAETSEGPGRRHADDNDPNTGTPMPTATLRLDNQPPLVEVLPVGRPDRIFGGQPWFSYRPFVVVSAVDQFGASGVASIEYRFGGPFGSYEPFVVTDPPVLPIGQTVVCGRATDVAGTMSDPVCTTIRADGEAPTFAFTASHAPDGDNDWYVTSPSFTASGYVDQPVPGAVGQVADHFRTRFDNTGFVDCDAPTCTIAASNFPSGRHLAHASAVDQFDNRSGEQTHEVLVDLENPVVVPVIAPADPDGFNGWWQTAPFLTLVGDDGDGSGIAALEYSLTGAGGPFLAWTEPVRIGAGAHQLCWRGSDVAGRDSAVGCRSFRIDLDDPTAAIAPSAAPNGDGWYAAPLVATASGGDPVPGSGVSSTFDPDLSDLCEDLSPAADPMSPSGQCISVDGGPYLPLTGPIVVGEGQHNVRTFTVDVSGRRSAVAESIFRVDLSPPVVDLRLQPPAAARNGWFRAEPMVVLRAADGHDGSGVVALEYRVDGGAWQLYREPFTLGQGTHTVEHRATDLVGSRSGSVTVRVDTTSPTVQATQPDRLIWSRLLGPSTINLHYTISDNLSGVERVSVVLFDVLGNPVRQIDDTTFGPGQQFVTWDGRQSSITGLVPIGVYTYRVFAVDRAGNWSQSGEAKPVTIRLL